MMGPPPPPPENGIDKASDGDPAPVPPPPPPSSSAPAPSPGNGMVPGSPSSDYGPGLIRAPAAMPLAETQQLNMQPIKQVPNARYNAYENGPTPPPGPPHEYGQYHGQPYPPPPRPGGNYPNYQQRYPHHGPTTPTLNQLLQAPNSGNGQQWRPPPGGGGPHPPHPYMQQPPHQHGVNQKQLGPPQVRSFCGSEQP